MCILLYWRSRRSSFLKIIDIGPVKIKTFKKVKKISLKENGKKVGRMRLCKMCAFSLKFNNI